MIKTDAQVSEWLRKQKWLRKFVGNIRNLTETSKTEALRILGGYYGANTIAAGFDWDRSPQGKEYWQTKDREFKEWYYGKG